MSTTTVQLLKAAAEIVGGHKALAESLGVAEGILGLYMADRRRLPDALLLRAVDIILEDREVRFSPTPLQQDGRGAGRARDSVMESDGARSLASLSGKS